MKPDYQRIRDLEHECEIGLPHEDCWDCDTASFDTPLPRLAEPIVTRQGGMIYRQHVAQKYLDKRQARWQAAVDSLLRAAR